MLWSCLHLREQREDKALLASQEADLGLDTLASPEATADSNTVLLTSPVVVSG